MSQSLPKQITITVIYLQGIARMTGKAEENLDLNYDATIGELLREIGRKYGENTRRYLIDVYKATTMIQRNGWVGTKRIDLMEGLDTILKDKDVVFYFQFMGGG